MPPFCHHPEPTGSVHDERRLSNVQQSDGADRVLQVQPHPAFQGIPDVQLFPGELLALTFDPGSGREVCLDPASSVLNGNHRQKINSTLTHVQVNGGGLYDVVTSRRSGVSVLALRSLWDQKHVCPIEPAKKPQSQQLNETPIPPPALPPKCKNRKLTGAVSIDTVALTQVRRARLC